MKSAAGLAWLSLARALLRGRAPGQAVIQYTDSCNASCAQCGMRRQNLQPRHRLGPERAGTLIDSLAAGGVKAISLTGGEPLLYLDEIAGLAARAQRAGIASVRTGSNGFIFQNHQRPGFKHILAVKAGLLKASGVNAFWLSLDSPDPEVHEANRGLPGVVAGMAAGLPVFHGQGLYPAANLGLGRLLGGKTPLAREPDESSHTFTLRCEEALSRFFSFALELGFTTANVCYPMRAGGPPGYEPVYAAADQGKTMDFSAPELAALLTALRRVVARFRSRLRIFTPISSMLALIARHENAARRGYPCLGGREFVFVAARDMRLYPCGYRGGEPIAAFPGPSDAQAGCDLCDWECFRDPSNLFGPVLHLARSPLAALRRLASDMPWTRAWASDLSYLRACGWFDATRPPDARRLAAFSPPNA